MRVKKYIRNREGAGVTSIYFCLCWNNKRLRVPANESIYTNDWSNKRYEPKGGQNNASLASRLFKKEQKFRDAFDRLLLEVGDAREISTEMLQQAIGARVKGVAMTKKNRIKRTLVSTFFQQLIDDTTIGVRRSVQKLTIKPNSIKPYQSCLKVYLLFEEYMQCKYYVDELCQQVVEDFEDYLTNIHGLALNTKSTYLKKFKILITYAKQKGVLAKNVEIDFTGLTRRENSDSIYLTEAEVDALIALSEFSDKTEELVRDIFVLACRTGLRYSDFSKLSIDQIRNGSIYVIQQKTNEKVTIPIHATAQLILDKYTNGFPACPLNQPFNDYLKIIGKRIPSLAQIFAKRITKAGRVQVLNVIKWKLLQCHTARRTFCTIEHMKGTPISIIMGISGHKDVKTFLNYVKSSSDEKAEQLRELWKERGEIG